MVQRVKAEGRGGAECVVTAVHGQLGFIDQRCMQRSEMKVIERQKLIL